MSEYAKIIALPKGQPKEKKSQQILLVSHRKEGDKIKITRTFLWERIKLRKKFLEDNKTCAN